MPIDHGSRDPRRGAAARPERALRARSSRARPRGWPRPAARCPSASCAAAGCSRSAAGPYATDAQHVVGRVRASGDRRQAGAAGARPAACCSARGSRRSSGRTTWSWASARPRATRRCGRRSRAPRRAGRMTFALPGASGAYAVAAASRRPVHPPGADRDPLPHALGDGPRLLRASRAGPRRRAGGLPLSVPRPREAGAGRSRGPGGLVDPDEGRRTTPRSARRWRASEAERDRRSRRWRSTSGSRRGGKLIIFGNGGSATDANDWAIDCVAPPAGMRPVPAVSLVDGAGDRHRHRQRRRHRRRLPPPAHRPGRARATWRWRSRPAAARAT